MFPERWSLLKVPQMQDSQIRKIPALKPGAGIIVAPCGRPASIGAAGGRGNRRGAAGGQDSLLLIQWNFEELRRGIGLFVAHGEVPFFRTAGGHCLDFLAQSGSCSFPNRPAGSLLHRRWKD